MSEAARIEEANRHIKTAQKKVKKGLMKWNISQTDYDTAAMEYEAAGKIFQHMKKYLAAVDAWENAAAMHEKADTLYHAAMAYDRIAQIYKEKKEPKGQAASIQKAAKLFLSDGKPDRYAQSLVQAAKVLMDDPLKEHDQAAALIGTALETLEGEEKWYCMPEPGRTLVAIRVKQGDYRAAAEAVKRCMKHYNALDQPHNTQKGCLEVVVLQLARDDHVLAQREYDQLRSSCPTFGSSDEGMAAQTLLDVYEEGDPDEVKKVLKQQIFTFLLPEIARMSRKITPSGPRKPKPASGSPSGGGGAAHADPTAAAPAEPEDADEDDDLAGLQ